MSKVEASETGILKGHDADKALDVIQVSDGGIHYVNGETIMRSQPNFSATSYFILTNVYECFTCSIFFKLADTLTTNIDITHFNWH